jgi:hypothetical protein
LSFGRLILLRLSYRLRVARALLNSIDPIRSAFSRCSALSLGRAFDLVALKHVRPPCLHPDCYVRQMSWPRSRLLLDKRRWAGRSQSKQRRLSAYDCPAVCLMPSIIGPKRTRRRVRRRFGAWSSAASRPGPTVPSRGDWRSGEPPACEAGAAAGHRRAEATTLATRTAQLADDSGESLI